MFFIDLPAQEVPSAIDVVAREMGNCSSAIIWRGTCGFWP